MIFSKLKTRITLTKERKIILAAGGVLLISGVLYRMYPFIQGLGMDGNTIRLKGEKLVKYQQLVSERNHLEERKTFLLKTVERAEYALLAGESPALAAVDLQNRLSEICLRPGAKIKTTRVLKPENVDDAYYMAIPIELGIDATIREVQEIVYQIESGEKYLTITRLNILAPAGKNEDKLNLTLVVQGYMRRQAN